MTNVVITPDLAQALDQLRAACRVGRGAGASDPHALPALVDALKTAKAAFANAPRTIDSVKARHAPLEVVKPAQTMKPPAELFDLPVIGETPETFDVLRRRVTSEIDGT